MLPKAWHETVESLAGECDSVIGAFLRGQFLVMLALGVIYAVGLSIVGLELALLIGLVAGIASVVPYLGTFGGVVAGLAAALVLFPSWWLLLGGLAWAYLGWPAALTVFVALPPLGLLAHWFHDWRRETLDDIEAFFRLGLRRHLRERLQIERDSIATEIEALRTLL